jgi:uncharacterized membrane protein
MSEDWRNWQTPPGGAGFHFGAAEVGALTHLYRGEVHRSTIWRTRLDATSNWSVVTLGLARSISFASPDASSLPSQLQRHLRVPGPRLFRENACPHTSRAFT